MTPDAENHLSGQVSPATESVSARNTVLKELEEERKRLLNRRSNGQTIYYALFATCILMPFLIAAIIWKFSFTPSIVLPLIYSCVPIALIPYVNALWRTNENDIQELDFQIDLHQYEATLREGRAEKVLRINNFQLRRYHDINLRQNTWVFCLGLFCILIGVAVIGVTFYLVLYAAQTLDAKIITGVLGGIGALLTNFIAAIYLKMHASAVGNLSSFYTKLVDTNQTLFGNLVASRIENEDLRDMTLSKLALLVAGSKEKDEKESQKGAKNMGKPTEHAVGTPSARNLDEAANT